MHCPMTGINIPRFLAAALAGFIFIFAFDYLVHHHLLMDIYHQTSNLWRAPEDMVLPWMFGTQALIALITAGMYTCHCKDDQGIKSGICFGIKIGLLMAVLMAASYAWMPIPLVLALSWAGAGLGTGLGLGIIFSLVYKK